MKISRQELTRRVERWRKRIVPDWEVQLYRKPPKAKMAGENGTSFGYVEADSTYRTAKVWINAEAIPNAAQLDETICHELVHLVHADVCKLVNELRSDLGRATRKAVKRRWQELEEHAAERLARALTRSKGTYWNTQGL